MASRQAHMHRSSVRPVNTASGSPRTGVRQTNNISGSQPAATDPESYWMNRCTAIRKDGKRCENRLRSQADKDHGMCVGHWNGRGSKKVTDDS